MNRHKSPKTTSDKKQATSVKSGISLRTILAIVMLIAITLAAYWPASRCGFIWDDDAYVQNNPHLRSFEGLKEIWFNPKATPQYYPLVFTTYWIEYHLWQLNPACYHIVNIFLHSLSAVLLWQVLLKLKIPGAWAAAAIFAVHPVTVESVAWITERKNVLSGVFYFRAILAYLKFAFTEEPTRGAKPHSTGANGGYGWYILALVLFVCALLGKTVAATLAGALFLILWWKRDRLGRADILSLVPFFAIGAILGLHTARLEVEHVGAHGAEWSLTWMERFLVAGRALCFYATKIVWPHPLIFFYERWNVSQEVWQQYLYMIPFPAVVITFWFLRKRLGKGPVVAALFFAGTLFPALGFLDVYPMRYSYVADHFQYLAMIGVVTLLIASGATLARQYSKTLKVPLIILLVFALAACGVLTSKQCGIYQDMETLWRDIIDKRPDPWMAYNNLGLELHKQKKYDEAIECFEKTIELKPDHFFAHNNLAAMYRIQNKPELALKHIIRALELDPKYATGYFTFSMILFDMGKTDQALAELRRAIELKPKFTKARFILAEKLSGLNKSQEALEQLHQILQDEPDHIGALAMIAGIYKSQHNYSKAIRYYHRLLAIKSDNENILNNLAWVLATCPDPTYRDPVQAVQLAEKACALSSYRLPDFIDTLAAAYAAQGEFDQAVIIAQKAVALAANTNNSSLSASIQDRIKLYQQHKPFFQSAP